jgi:hypothetical protein
MDKMPLMPTTRRLARRIRVAQKQVAADDARAKALRRKPPEMPAFDGWMTAWYQMLFFSWAQMYAGMLKSYM